MVTRLRKTGIAFVDSLPWGTHLCQFYETKQDLLDVLVPYFKAGLENNELCLWITSEPLKESEARKVMMEAVWHFDSYLERGQMEIVSYADWYLKDGSFNQQRALDTASRRMTAMKDKGYSGLRASGNVGWLPKQSWDDFTRYEGVVSSLIAEHQVMTICSYPLAMCGVLESLHVMKNHRLALIKHEGVWQVIENLGQTKTEAALKETEERYRNLFESTQDGMEVIDGGTGRIVLANQAVARIFGFDTPQDMIGVDPLDYIPSEDREHVAAMMSGYMFEKDMHRVVELRALRKDGALIWLSALGVKTEYRGRLAGLVSLRDVTERKQAEQALSDSERRYRLLAENVSDVIWVTDMNLRPIYFSPSISRLLGYSVEEAMEGTMETMLTSASLEAAAATFKRVLALEQREPGRLSGAGTLELEFKRKDGSTVWADTTVSILRDPSGRPVEILGVLRDVSDRKKAGEQLHHSLEVLERTMEDTIQAIASTVETKDLYTAGHQRRVTQLACSIAREMGLSRERMRVIRTAGLLHDLGKISLPTDILTKPGNLTEIEMAVIRTHPQVAYDVLKNIESFGQIADVVLQHHERMDGSGYPSGLHGEEILLEARILAVSDVVEAMFSHRPYRPALGLQKAREEIARNSGTLYDPEVVGACLTVFDQTGFEFGE
ncbi:MAG: PAS domain S-box protein [Dehalococcoidia bacterium]|nr:PAS domain S-box protein [Dehalococcoidia bacterium]